MRARSLLFGSTLAAGALLLSACSSTETPKAEEPDRLSIDSLINPGASNVDWQDEERRIQEAIATCMREQGWEYRAVEYPYEESEYSDADWEKEVRERGWGIVYYTLHSGDVDNFDDPWSNWVDPNTEYVESLSEAEVTAYYESLYGTPEEIEAITFEEVDPETGETYMYQNSNAGCYGEAEKEVRGNQPWNDPDYWSDVEKFYMELNERVLADPRMVEINNAWVVCMKDRGFTYTSQEEFWEKGYQSIYSQLEEIVPNQYADPFEGWSDTEIEDFFATATNAEIDALWGPPELTDDQRTRLEALLEEEIKIAVAEFECNKPHSEKSAEIYAEIEEKYVLENEAALREIGEKYGAK